MRTDVFNYSLPRELIAQQPSPRRDNCRLLVLNRKNGQITHTVFHKITDFLNEGDVLVLNDTRVIPARLIGTKEGTGARLEVLLLRNVASDVWEVLIKPGRRVREETAISFGDGELAAKVREGVCGGRWIVEFEYCGDFREILTRIGKTPLPPYIRREEAASDRERYQTVYARNDGAIAAPTAGLHFTEGTIERLRGRGIMPLSLTLHTGIGTFLPLREGEVTEHKMEPEFYRLGKSTADAINNRGPKARLVAVGTTVVRVLETLAKEGGEVSHGSGQTSLFIYPGFTFRLVSALITNLHPPLSTPLILCCAFCGRELIFRAYEEAIERKYRFCSYGDAMLIL